MSRKTYITQEGHDKLKVELDQLKKVKRVDVAEKIKEARESGDILENSVYDAAVEEQSYIESRIIELEEIVNSATILKHDKSGHDQVTVGCTVVVNHSGKEVTYKLVGSVEADPAQNLISDESPVGQALIGAKIGDIVQVNTPQLNIKYKVLDIK